MSASNPDISVIICTRDRAESLRETLACLARADRSGLQVEILVVDNGSADPTGDVAESFAGQLPVRYRFESKRGAYGKSHPLNCALDSDHPGDLVAVLDDDISVGPAWWYGVQAISRCWPDADLVTGHCYPIWPSGEIPVWARRPGLQGWLFSVLGSGTQDTALRQGQWFSGNHFWFRSRGLASGRRFADTWLTEPGFKLQLVQEGFKGVRGPGASAGHRIQRHLLAPPTALHCAELTGRAFAQVRLSPCRATVRNARWAQKHPVLARAACVALCLKWSWCCWQLRNVHDADVHFADILVAVERRAHYRAVLRILWASADYQVLRRPWRKQTLPVVRGSTAARVA